jgi:hypothetical protein
MKLDGLLVILPGEQPVQLDSIVSPARYAVPALRPRRGARLSATLNI